MTLYVLIPDDLGCDGYDPGADVDLGGVLLTAAVQEAQGRIHATTCTGISRSGSNNFMFPDFCIRIKILALLIKNGRGSGSVIFFTLINDVLLFVSKSTKHIKQTQRKVIVIAKKSLSNKIYMFNSFSQIA